MDTVLTFPGSEGILSLEDQRMQAYIDRLVAQLADCRKTAEASPPGYDRDAANHRAEGLRLALQLLEATHGKLPQLAASALTDQLLSEMAVEP